MPASTTSTRKRRAALAAQVRDLDPERRERVRLALVELRRQGAKVTINAVQRVAGGDRNAIAALVAASREGILPPIDDPWDRLAGERAPGGATGAPVPAPAQGAPAASPAPASPAQGAPPEATLDALLAALAAPPAPGPSPIPAMVAQLVATGAISNAVARTLLDSERERRQAAKAAQGAQASSAPPASALLVEVATVPLVQAFEGIADPERRERAMRLVLAIADEDRLDPRYQPDAGAPDDAAASGDDE